ncbi:hypothetical protein CBF31_08655 [Vagococcus fessus]|uniref:Uncharacterized protein n=1 Tax=Vagococcus fessus TaxID=120370 RepID=A0A430A6C6_9ENTE|nr:hypothetical protein CBF31_08655 [Vagococcus fessus]
MFTSGADSLLGVPFNYWGSEEYIKDSFPDVVVERINTEYFIKVNVSHYIENTIPLILSLGDKVKSYY